MAAGIIDLRNGDPEGIYLQAFERRGGLDAMFSALAGVGSWDLDLSDKLYEIYLSHIRHVVATRRDIDYFRDFSEHMLRVRDLLKRSNSPLSRRIGVLEDIVDEALAALPSSERPARSRKHIIEILKTLGGVPTMKRAELRQRHALGDANTSRILRDMEEEGLVARRQCGRDVTVEITAGGREELAAALEREGLAPRGLQLDLDTDNSPEALATFVLARLSPERLADEGDQDYPVLFGRDLGATLARYCRGGQEGEQKFDETWGRLIASPLASFDSTAKAEPAGAGRFRLALMSLLQCYAREAADTNALIVRKSSPDRGKTLLELVLDLHRGHWSAALQAAEKLGDALEATRMEPPGVLLIGVSGYHEERILGRLASDIFLLQRGYDGLQLASSPWASEGVVEGVNEQFGRRIGAADIRMVNMTSLLQRDTGAFVSGPVFRHVGYRAFANQAWLWSQAEARQTPAAVKAWIASYFDRGPTDAYGADTLAARAWLCLKGGPVNYEKTEFPALFDYLKSRCKGLDPQPPALPLTADDPDDVFEKFVSGDSNVIVSGSIHDLLLQDYWADRNRAFVQLLDTPDFRDWYASHDEVGLNIIRFSKRLAGEQEIAPLVHELYVRVLEAALVIARGRQSPLRHALFAYLATILAPSHRESWNTDVTDTRWSFAGNLESIGKLLKEELEPCKPTPARHAGMSPGVSRWELSRHH